MSVCSGPENSVSDKNSIDDDTNEKSMKLKYRVRVCLQNYFSDERARCYVLVWKRRRVRWLEQRLRDLFALRGQFWLRSRGYLLPSAESLAILEPDDLVEVVPKINETDSTHFSKSQYKEKSNVIPVKNTTSEWKEIHEEDSNISHQDINLESVKMQALALLNEKYCDKNGNCSSKERIKFEDSNYESNAYPIEYPAPKRRRVRHRKRNSKVPLNETTEDCIDCALAAPTAPSAPAAPTVRPASPDPVQRNRIASTRAPRLVRSLL
ncbi:uncharacterized protein LOC119834807 [Zerene cesonia]|uniref:uncharacterized protein LOC119834807 n=1 Tax=Zerene cesonia TaxID=33412 RepID=UPI0018E4EF4D|nr:uncharacterized protein LOC119834807 [Zerene cesonia]